MKKLLLVAGACLLLSGPALAQRNKNGPQGAAAGSNAEGASATLERCDQPLGTVGVVEEQSGDWYRYLTSDLRLPSTIPLIRMMIQQSNCFVVVERGHTLDRSELLAFLGQRLARYKLPRELVFVDALPRTAIGKIDKKRLAAEPGTSEGAGSSITPRMATRRRISRGSR